MPNNPRVSSNNDVTDAVATPVADVAVSASNDSTSPVTASVSNANDLAVPVAGVETAPVSAAKDSTSPVTASLSDANDLAVPVASAATAPVNTATVTISSLTTTLSEPISQVVTIASIEVDNLANVAGQQVNDLGKTVNDQVDSFLNNPALNQTIETKVDTGLKKLSSIIESFTNDGTAFLKTLLMKLINASHLSTDAKAELIAGLNLGSTSVNNFLNTENVKLEAAAEKFISKELPILEKKLEEINDKIIDKIETFAKEEISDAKAFIHKVANKITHKNSNDLGDDNSSDIEVIYTEIDIITLGDSIDIPSSDF